MGRGESERAAASLTQQDILARATPRQVLRSPYSMKWASHKWQNIVTLCTYMKTQGWKKKKKTYDRSGLESCGMGNRLFGTTDDLDPGV